MEIQEPLFAELATADPPVLALSQLPFTLEFDEPVCGMNLLVARVQKKRRSAQQRRESRDRTEANARHIALMQSDLFMQEFKRLFPDTGGNAYDWSGLAQELHIAMLTDALDDIRDPSCNHGTQKHAELWTWIFGIDRACQIPFSFEACCAYAEEDPEFLREALLPYFVREPGVPHPRRLSLRGLAHAHGLSWEEWRVAQGVYRTLTACIDEARKH